jgi:hypothetical protein
MVLASTSGPMEGNMLVIGNLMRWSILEYTNGLMAGGIKGFTEMIRSMVLESTPGQIRRCIQVGGMLVSSMDWGYLRIKMGNRE